MQPVISQIIDAGICAPSGENSQPWRFRVTGLAIDIIKVPARDNPMYNFAERGTYLAIGALLENMIIRAEALGYAAAITPPPPAPGETIVARLTLEASAPSSTLLNAAIEKRATNRKPYLRRPLSAVEKGALMSAASLYPESTLKLVETDGEKRVIAAATSMTERIMLQNRALHHAFFRNICWTEDEEGQKRSGLYLPTMELAPPQQKMFSLLRHWSVARLFAFIGLPSVIAKGNAANYRQASAFGAFVSSPAPHAVINTGRSFERLWLTATVHGLSLQPLAAIAYLADRVRSGDTRAFRTREITQILAADEQLRHIFHISPDAILPMIFRLGEGDGPSARSSRQAALVDVIA